MNETAAIKAVRDLRHLPGIKTAELSLRGRSYPRIVVSADIEKDGRAVVAATVYGKIPKRDAERLEGLGWRIGSRAGGSQVVTRSWPANDQNDSQVAVDCRRALEELDGPSPEPLVVSTASLFGDAGFGQIGCLFLAPGVALGLLIVAALRLAGGRPMTGAHFLAVGVIALFATILLPPLVVDVAARLGVRRQLDVIAFAALGLGAAVIPPLVELVAPGLWT